MSGTSHKRIGAAMATTTSIAIFVMTAGRHAFSNVLRRALALLAIAPGERAPRQRRGVERAGTQRTVVKRLDGGRSGRGRYAIAAYTVMEVMISLGVLSIGATGVIALQKATVIGNVLARDLSTANAVSSAWIERLRVDGLSWKRLLNGSSSIGSTQWLKQVGADFPVIAGNEGQWIRPDPVGNYTAESNVQGKDMVVPPGPLAPPPGFCTNIRLTQLTPSLIRAEVRVFWLRRKGGGTLNQKPLCDNDPSYLAGIEAERSRYHFVYMTTGILRNDGHE